MSPLKKTIFLPIKTNNQLLKSFRYFLFPFSLLYGAAIWTRNQLYDRRILKSAQFNFPIICVGNLAVGGTGKTPMTEYLIKLLKERFQIATLSRGYKRKTKGFAIANENTTAIDIGDEPMQFHQKFPDITVSVGEERMVAIPQLLQSKPGTQVIILDDGFQHRMVQAGMNILLTDYKNLYSRDLMLPAGDLRDIKSSSQRADIIVVTKCKESLTTEEKEQLRKELHVLPNQTMYCTAIAYGQPYHLFNGSHCSIDSKTDVLLLCGIANPKPLKDYLTSITHSYEMIRFADHHIFSTDDLNEIKQHFQSIESSHKIIVTTEKDAVRLEKFRKEIADFPIYVLPITHQFLLGEEERFKQQVLTFIEGFKN